jgi:transcriptional regulator with XRE-family HTH domain
VSAQNKTNPVLLEPASASPGRVLTYEDLWEFHKTNLEARLKSEGKALNLVNNHFSSLKRWLELASWRKLDEKPGSATLYDEVGDELNARFDECLKQFLDDLKAKPKGYQSTKDPKSHITKIQESWFLLLRSGALPEEFAQALKALIDKTDKTTHAVSREVGIADSRLRDWLSGKYRPHAKTLNQLSALEKYFKVQAGTLRSRLPTRIYGSREEIHNNTPYRIYLKEMRKKKYTLQESLTPRLKEEYDDLYRFFTDGVWVSRQNLKRGGPGWRVNPKTKKCSTARTKLKYVRDFMGFLCLSTDSPDPHLRGKGFRPDDLSLILLADVGLVYDFVEFYRGRVFNQVYNFYVKNFLDFCKQLTHPKTGYFTQHIHFSQRLPVFLKQMRDANDRKESAA